jgi:hypothetical protein
LSCAAATVFKLIAPAKTSRATSRAESLRDIECLRGIVPRQHSISIYTNVKKLTRRACTEKNTVFTVGLFAGLSPEREPPAKSCRGILSFRSCRVNGTVVLGPAPSVLIFVDFGLTRPGVIGLTLPLAPP